MQYGSKQQLKIGILGGTFNPPHNAHLFLANTICFHYELDELHLIVAKNPPHKEVADHVDADIRFQMVKTAVCDNTNLIANDIELNRSGPSFSIDTIRYFEQNLFPNAQLYLIIGSDLVYDFHKWKDYEKILNKTKIITVVRSPEDFNNYHIPYKQMEIFTEWLVMDISSTKIREMVKKNQPIQYLLPNSVIEIIKRNNLYKC